MSECCRAMKITPGRQLTRNLGCGLQFTGQRGKREDRLQGYRNIEDGAIVYQARDRMWIANPLTGWKDRKESEVKGYIEQNGLPQHPARARGAGSIGCVYCGGGSQFTNSGYRALRQTWPEAWYRFMVTWGGGIIILALKYHQHIQTIQDAVNELGGLASIAKWRPWVFDFTRRTPLPGYTK